ncbi:MAG: hypothetical protein GY750_01095 [Lentisphaerae bacterium]|nr:hypothetical protein [Lentisphaerota bacterium]MCP4100014.1 hypothetical protein [Lentisphaerota bacterium]
MSNTVQPWDGIEVQGMPGYWLFASLGKKALRPGGLSLTSKMLDKLNITSEDDIMEYSPGVGLTAQLALERTPLGAIPPLSMIKLQLIN